MKKILSIVLAAIMVMALGVTAFAAETDTTTTPDVTQSISVAMYKDGTYGTADQDLSMGNDAFAPGGYIYTYYERDTDGNIVYENNVPVVKECKLVLNVTSVTYALIITGYMSDISIEGTDMVATATDSDGNVTQFTGTFTEAIQLGVVYNATVNISVGGYMNTDTQGDLVFTLNS